MTSHSSRVAYLDTFSARRASDQARGVAQRSDPPDRSGGPSPSSRRSEVAARLARALTVPRGSPTSRDVNHQPGPACVIRVIDGVGVAVPVGMEHLFDDITKAAAA